MSIIGTFLCEPPIGIPSQRSGPRCCEFGKFRRFGGASQTARVAGIVRRPGAGRLISRTIKDRPRGANHTYSRVLWRDQLHDWTVAWLRQFS